jgi:hypothetical protein
MSVDHDYRLIDGRDIVCGGGFAFFAGTARRLHRTPTPMRRLIRTRAPIIRRTEPRVVRWASLITDPIRRASRWGHHGTIEQIPIVIASLTTNSLSRP